MISLSNATWKLYTQESFYQYASLLFLDECVTGSHNCDANAACSDTESGFTCSCNSGYTGDGVTCDKITCAAITMPSGDYDCTEASFGLVVTKKTAPVLDVNGAKNHCAADGANVHLPTPKNDAENEWYNDHMTALKPPGSDVYFWLGIYESSVEGRGGSTENFSKMIFHKTS